MISPLQRTKAEVDLPPREAKSQPDRQSLERQQARESLRSIASTMQVEIFSWQNFLVVEDSWKNFFPGDCPSCTSKRLHHQSLRMQRTR